MADEQTTVVNTPVPVGWDTTDFHAFKKMASDPDASNAATELWNKTAAPVEVEEPATETEVEPAATEEPVSDTGEEPEDEEVDDDEPIEPGPKKKSGYRRKIDKLEREIAALKAGQQQPKAEEAPPAARKAPPKLSEFDYDEDKHAAAMAEYLRSSISAEQKTLRQQEEQRGQQKAYADSEKEVRKQHSDYDEVLGSIEDLIFGPAAIFAITNSDKKAKLSYAIASQPELAQKIHDLSNSKEPVDHLRAVRLIGLVEGKLLAPTAEAPKPPVVSKAPPPGKPIAARAGAATRTAAQILDEYSSTGDMTKAHKLAAEYEKLTGKALI